MKIFEESLGFWIDSSNRRIDLFQSMLKLLDRRVFRKRVEFGKDFGVNGQILTPSVRKCQCLFAQTQYCWGDVMRRLCVRVAKECRRMHSTPLKCCTRTRSPWRETTLSQRRRTKEIQTSNYIHHILEARTWVLPALPRDHHQSLIHIVAWVIMATTITCILLLNNAYASHLYLFIMCTLLYSLDRD
jgi:hypothetical protein